MVKRVPHTHTLLLLMQPTHTHTHIDCTFRTVWAAAAALSTGTLPNRLMVTVCGLLRKSHRCHRRLEFRFLRSLHLERSRRKRSTKTHAQNHTHTRVHGSLTRARLGVCVAGVLMLCVCVFVRKKTCVVVIGGCRCVVYLQTQPAERLSECA